jgi:excinuclease ABC subunit C
LINKTVRSDVTRLPDEPGVYRFRDERGRVLYIGRALHLRRRVGSYWTSLGDRPHLRRMVARIDRIEAVACGSEHEAAWLERNLLERSLPYWNRTPGGAEVPVYLRLDAKGVAVVHAPDGPGEHFGPYLGGAKVRLAHSGLNRALPVHYASDRLQGSLREMARLRGVEPAERADMVRRLIDVLRRDPVAVQWLRGELIGRRDRAAGDLAFELAAKIQQELEAVDWVVSPQRVSLMDSHDVDVYGWADGVLVRFEVRAGRMCAFSVRGCAQQAALPRLDTTPAQWVEFAQRNAELAARLSCRAVAVPRS